MVEVMGYIPHDEAISQMISASILLMAIPDTPGNKGIVTGKFFEYLAAKRPILAIGPKGGDIDIMIRDCKAGKLFSYDEKDEMAHFILDIFEQSMHDTCIAETTGTEKYTRRNLTEELVRIF
jgi:glycosyltransferase involved in cell wall biosynthesis